MSCHDFRGCSSSLCPHGRWCVLLLPPFESLPALTHTPRLEFSRSSLRRGILRSPTHCRHYLQRILHLFLHHLISAGRRQGRQAVRFKLATSPPLHCSNAITSTGGNRRGDQKKLLINPIKLVLHGPWVCLGEMEGGDSFSHWAQLCFIQYRVFNRFGTESIRRLWECLSHTKANACHSFVG